MYKIAYNQYLNSRGDASPHGELASSHQDLAPPHRELASSHQDLAPPHRDLGVLPLRVDCWMIRRKIASQDQKILQISCRKWSQIVVKTFFFLVIT